MARYYGESGYTNASIKGFHKAMQRVKDARATITLVSYIENGDPNPVFHGFIVNNWGKEELYVVRPGFCSGYNGEGPRGLADCFRAIPAGVEVRQLKLNPYMAQDVFDGEHTNRELRELLEHSNPLMVQWDQEGNVAQYDWFIFGGLWFRDSEAQNPYYEIRSGRH